MQTYSQFSFKGTISGTTFFLRQVLAGAIGVIPILGAIGLMIGGGASMEYGGSSGLLSIVLGIILIMITLAIVMWYNLATVWKRANAISPDQPGLAFALYLLISCTVYFSWLPCIVFTFMNSKVETHNG